MADNGHGNSYLSFGSTTRQENIGTMLASLRIEIRPQEQGGRDVPFMFRSSRSSTTYGDGDSDQSTPMVIDSESVEGGERGSNERRIEERDGFSFTRKENEASVEEAKRREDIVKEYDLDGLNCAICMEPWRSEGDHQVSCLPCGHLYGFSCICKWLQRPVPTTKCPQCNAKCKFKDIRKLYTTPVVVIDEGLQKKVESLENEIGSLKTEKSDLLDIQDNLLEIQDNLLKLLRKLKEKPACTENTSFEQMGSKPHQFFNPKEAQGFSCGSYSSKQLLHCNFKLQHELAIEGGRLFAMDFSYQNLILTRRIAGMGGMHMLNKVNLINPRENEDIQLPPSTKAVKDIQISPCGRLTLLASLGKKLSILSMESNNIVVTYNLRVPAWSCSWDLNSPHYVYAGLQNGMLLVFDMRGTLNPLQSMVGPVPGPIHTMYPLTQNLVLGSNSQKLLTASSLGLCVWNTDTGKRPFLVPGFENQGMCTSLAYGPLSDDIVASYHPKSKKSNATVNSQCIDPDLSPFPGSATLCSQLLVKRISDSHYRNLGSTSAYLSNGHMARTAIINMQNCFPLFAYGDEATRGLRLKELPSFNVTQNLKPHHHPILDVKYAHNQDTGILGSVSEDKLQLFSADLLQKR
ncbi:PREDICTED: E3 ubiquitin-protein ligase RFWD3-like isoform X2 [Populus euphratica]|uniref:RING-type E3 ubiquitin transferase n=1 Tax=Populus euphratica TaxID=75702 RepID=A0AAJ6XMG8_POPEU|nr:PREDICTED: E3 ubiquitin-protein ligase RFWD3-like isoform X2 [Populus euphratica]